ncbi:hypothetical protein [Kaistella palustris]|uniref:hypothetical protein n=1 Tax=Kaistella palustris TaxID=493376 RepID=UPI0003FD555A|nr:hypothetical protein [Kaistella palustris]
MQFSKKEKQFWQKHYHLDKPSQLHENWDQIWSIDGNEDDDFFYFFTLRVTSIVDVHLKGSEITDKAVEYMLKFEQLKNLFLRRHQNITKASIPFFNEMKNLETLDISKTQITLTDLCEDLNNQSLKQVCLNEDEDEENVEGKLAVMRERMPNCEIILY